METTDYCNYDLSLALKAAGFDEPCLTFYDTNKELGRALDTDNFNHLGETYQGEWFTDTISAPTLWQAQKWLREKHGLHILVDVDLYGKWYYKLFPIGGCCVDEGNSGYVTYEAALSAGILAALDLITKGE